MSEVEATQNMEQKTEAWLTFRSKRIGASEAPIIMGDSPYSTPYKLLATKRGLVPRQLSNFAIDRGNRFEPVARALYELDTGLELPAAILVHPRYDFIMASLDGYDKARSVACEIKIAGREVFEAAKAGLVHQNYYAQVQHQLEVTGAKENHFFVCICDKVFGEDRILESALVVAKRDAEYVETKLIPAELAFYRHMIEGTWPALCHADVVEITDKEAIEIASKDKVDKDALIKRIAAISDHTNFKINGHGLARNTKGSWVLRAAKA